MTQTDKAAEDFAAKVNRALRDEVAALEAEHGPDVMRVAVESLRKLRAPAPEAEPVAWLIKDQNGRNMGYTSAEGGGLDASSWFTAHPLYARPQDAESLRAERDAALARIAELENALAASGNELTAAWHQLDTCPPPPAFLGGDIRPKNCRFRLQDEGKAYPKSSCQACGKGVFTGLGKSCAQKGGAA